jgi:hypothetical protein
MTLVVVIACSVGQSDFDAAEIYTAAGYALSADKESVFVYYGGMAYTHGTAGEPAAGRHNSGVGAARLRLDGFVSINADRVFNVPTTNDLPSFTTVELTLPSAVACPAPTNGTGHVKPTPDTICSEQLPGNTCNVDGYAYVNCSVAQDCATKTKQPLAGLTCGGVVVGCRDGHCKTPKGRCLCELTGPPEPPPSTLDGGLVLELNVETGVAGLVYVELQDESGAPLGGHSLAEARGTRGNYVRKVATWVGGSSLTSLAGKKVTMRVVMTDAKLFSATFKCATSTE